MFNVPLKTSSIELSGVDPSSAEVSAHSLVMYISPTGDKNILQNEAASDFAPYQNIDPSASSMIFLQH